VADLKSELTQLQAENTKRPKNKKKGLASIGETTGDKLVDIQEFPT